MVGITGNHLEQGINHRGRPRGGEQPTRFVADQHALAFEQRPHAACRQAVLGNQRHTPQPGLQPLTNLRDRRLSLQFAPGRRHQRHTSGQRTQRTALCQHRGPFEQRHLGRS